MVSLIGATFVFPGVSMLVAGTVLSKPPFWLAIWLGPCLPYLVDWPSNGTYAGFVCLSYSANLSVASRGPIPQSPLGASLCARAAKYGSCIVHMHVTMAAALCTCMLLWQVH